MGPRSTTLPQAQTESARELRRAFFCDLCQKGYARINELEAHESSYDHLHRKRAKDTKALMRNPTAAVRDSRAEKKRKENSEMLSVNLQESGGGGGGGGVRPGNVTGFRDAMQIKSLGAGAGAGAGAGGMVVGKGFPDEREKREGGGGGKVMEEKVMRPPVWDELDGFYTLVDASALPAEMQDTESRLPWEKIWADKDEMDSLLFAVDGEMGGLEAGGAKRDLKRVWEDMSEGSDLDELDEELES